MRQFVDDGKIRAARENRVEIQFLNRDASVFNLPARDARKPGQECLGLYTAVTLDIREDDVAPKRGLFPGGFQHRIGLAHAGRVPQENSQLAPLLAPLLGLSLLEQGLWAGTCQFSDSCDGSSPHPVFGRFNSSTLIQDPQGISSLRVVCSPHRVQW